LFNTFSAKIFCQEKNFGCEIPKILVNVVFLNSKHRKMSFLGRRLLKPCPWWWAGFKGKKSSIFHILMSEGSLDGQK
jgi:hypothetical protein